ncbi:pyroglutamyl-peptidase I [Lactobacillus sp. Sy-1]|uniref:pyroglutamyl-peptidase I n=1 Tax=Lactobacillus sp. Sy-1 TaxID=2109645 RepID=UPI001C5B8EAA|nr:pyroglutamyl-peptidase I [Lactobacillus sp. Sy-1]MBW1606145.1 pyroglutamyl-peptidase I [Lactobacillus sp. Sy-1]
MKVIITGFTPFNNQLNNPSLDILHALPDVLDCAEIIKQPLPTEFEKSTNLITNLIDRVRPNLVLNLGQANGRNGITPELAAFNMDDAQIPDNAGYQPERRPIRSDGEEKYFSNLPIKAIVRNIRDIGVESRISTSAGSYVCNHVMYEVQYLLHKKYPDMKAGFIHVPSNYSENYEIPTMALDDEVNAIEIALMTAIYHLSDDIAIEHPYEY